ncbi:MULTISPECIES: glutathione S-transferase [unclassified Yoonia]|uniref:glutathione S-transferase n=1 Tax=unclassified Yoonia TaxID=2629118 RepID=UPI002AFF257B|nr:MULTISPECIES: glutathione S-transferase [unclassified Yoonia]
MFKILPPEASNLLQSLPILWSFRRCPYAMRARLAIHASGVPVALREILLRDKPADFLATSPKGTVPVVDTGTQVIAESRDIMLWALAQNDPEGWLNMPQQGRDLIDLCDGPFKAALDHTKYAVRYPDLDPEDERQKAMDFLRDLDARLTVTPFLLGPERRMADMAILPFVRQFAQIERVWFDAQGLFGVARWLTDFTRSTRFAAVMQKHEPWQSGQDQVLFP